MPTNINKPTTLTLLTLMLVAQTTQAYVLSMSYDEGEPWRKLAASDNEMYAFLLGTFSHQPTDFSKYSAQAKSVIDIQSSKLPTSLLFRAYEQSPKKSIAALSKPQREALYKDVEMYSDDSLTTKFTSDFSWCAHAKLPKACRNAASALKSDDHIVKVDGTTNKAAGARALLLHRAEVLERKSQKQEIKAERKAKRIPRQQFAHPRR